VFVCRWEYDAEHYCSDVRRTPLYETGPLLLDIIDTCIFDFIIGNADRHRYEVFENDPRGMLIMFDNGKRYTVAFKNIYLSVHLKVNVYYRLKEPIMKILYGAKEWPSCVWL